MRRARLLGLAFVVSLLAITAEAGAVVLDMGGAGRFGLIVPNADYRWSFGDGTSAIGASVVHSYSKGGTYNVALFVTDRGGNTSALSQTITVLGAGGQSGSQPHDHSSRGLHARLQLVPQGLGRMLRYGVALRVTSNKQADGIATLSISRKVAKRAHIGTGRGATVVIGRGTVSGIRNGTVKLHLRLSRTIKSKLGHMDHVTVTVRLALFASGGDHIAIDAAGRY